MRILATRRSILSTALRYSYAHLRLPAAILCLGVPLVIAQSTPAVQDHPYEDRRSLEQSAAATADPSMLNRLAMIEELYPDRGATAYSRLADALPSSSPERVNALVRAFAVALRDGQLQQATAFASALDSAGHSEQTLLLHSSPNPADQTIIPGGVAALAYMSQIQSSVSADRILAEFARKVSLYVCWKCQGERLTPTIEPYFAAIGTLEAIGQRNGNTVTVTLSLNTPDARDRTKNALAALGIKLRSEKEAIHLDHDKNPLGKPDILIALGFDENALRDALQAGKPFPLVLHDEPATVYPSAALWKSSFPNFNQKQFPLALLHDAAMARLYLGIATLDRETAKALVGGNSLYYFQGQPADMLSIYGSSFAVAANHAWVPGGPAAEPVWTQLAGVSPGQPGAFFFALIQAQNPTLLTYFYTLSRLDPRHQRFLTANVARARRFYVFFQSLPESKPYAGETTHGATFSDLIGAIPLDDTAHALLPGSAAVWIGQPSKSTASPEQEDDFLVRLLAARPKSNVLEATDFSLFLSVAYIDAHRRIPLDEASARLLAEHARQFSPFYPYFTTLTAVDADGFASFFRLADAIVRLPTLQQQLAWEEFDSLSEWLVVLQQNGSIPADEAAHQFRLAALRLAAASGVEDRSLASVELARAIVAVCGRSLESSPDDKLRQCLLGSAGPQREASYRAILEQQKAPSLSTVFAVAAAAQSALAGSPPKQILNPAFPSLPLSGDSQPQRSQRDLFLAYDPTALQHLLEVWNTNAAKPSPDPQETHRLAVEILRTVEPQVALALAAPVYAWSLRDSDRAVSDDPFLLRKHQFLGFTNFTEHRLDFDSGYNIESTLPFGTYFQGSFANFELTSAYAAATGWPQAGQGGHAVVAENIAAIRATPWQALSETDQRIVALRILAAREWILAAAQDFQHASAAHYASLAVETLRLLSLARRADLLHGIQDRDWPRVWASVTLPDLFRLGGRYLDANPPDAELSPVIAQLRAAIALHSEHPDSFANIPTHLLGCDHLHLVAEGPYEDSARQSQPAVLAERAAEFKLFLAVRADSLGVPPAQLSQAAETLARKTFSLAQMVDYYDWRALLAAYAGLADSDLQAALPVQPSGER
jgi:hypothetical protein